MHEIVPTPQRQRQPADEHRRATPRSMELAKILAEVCAAREAVASAAEALAREIFDELGEPRS
jgi:hypothetical protein